MAGPVKFRVYPSQLIHIGKAKNAGPDLDYLFISLCGRTLIGYPVGHEPEDWEICKACRASFNHARGVYQKLERKFI